ncbi:AAA-type ATPase lid domain-containing protein [Dongshaea marina]|uniref:helix-turn-helix domain-containing protein n=1 Tax=Dongshaea marina TaxID=2047966 RepID=UPI000D3E71B4|nr:helix-turn-helix domain-containing protein [Dongshaea marina]
MRERRDDLEALIKRQLEQLASQHRTPLTLAKTALEQLCHYRWPGNIPELYKQLENMVLHRHSNHIGLRELPAEIIQPQQSPQTEGEALIQPLELIEKQAIQHAWTLCEGKATETAKALGIGRTTLWRKLKKYRLIEGDESLPGQ